MKKAWRVAAKSASSIRRNATVCYRCALMQLLDSTFACDTLALFNYVYRNTGTVTGGVGQNDAEGRMMWRCRARKRHSLLAQWILKTTFTNTCLPHPDKTGRQREREIQKTRRPNLLHTTENGVPFTCTQQKRDKENEPSVCCTMPNTHLSRLPFASNLTGIPTQNVISITNSFRPRVYTPTNPRDANNVKKTK